MMEESWTMQYTWTWHWQKQFSGQIFWTTSCKMSQNYGESWAHDNHNSWNERNKQLNKAQINHDNNKNNPQWLLFIACQLASEKGAQKQEIVSYLIQTTCGIVIHWQAGFPMKRILPFWQHQKGQGLFHEERLPKSYQFWSIYMSPWYHSCFDMGNASLNPLSGTATDVMSLPKCGWNKLIGYPG